MVSVQPAGGSQGHVFNAGVFPKQPGFLPTDAAMNAKGSAPPAASDSSSSGGSDSEEDDKTSSAPPNTVATYVPGNKPDGLKRPVEFLFFVFLQQSKPQAHVKLRLYLPVNDHVDLMTDWTPSSQRHFLRTFQTDCRDPRVRIQALCLLLFTALMCVFCVQRGQSAISGEAPSLWPSPSSGAQGVTWWGFPCSLKDW